MQDKIFIKGENKTNEVYSYKYVYNKCYIVFKGGKRYTYNAKDVKIVKPSKEEIAADNLFRYFRELAKNVGIETKRDGGISINILDKNYQKISEIKKESVLFNYLTQSLPLEDYKPKDTFSSFLKLVKSKNASLKDTIIYPFGFNLSQKEAVEKAVKNKLSVIEGPPGTGKTQTILNIIANAIMHNENIAVVSSNNSAKTAH